MHSGYLQTSLEAFRQRRSSRVQVIAAEELRCMKWLWGFASRGSVLQMSSWCHVFPFEHS